MQLFHVVPPQHTGHCAFSCLSASPQSDCQIHLQSQVAAPHMEDYLSSIHVHTQASSQLNKLRIYLSVAQLLDYSISDEMTKVRQSSHKPCFWFCVPCRRPVSPHFSSGATYSRI